MQRVAGKYEATTIETEKYLLRGRLKIGKIGARCARSSTAHLATIAAQTPADMSEEVKNRGTTNTPNGRIRRSQKKLGIHHPMDARVESAGAAGSRNLGSTAFSDFALLFRRMIPGHEGRALTRGQYVRVLPVASGVHACFVTIFMIVEASGGSGGTSGVASARAVLVCFVHIGLLLLAVLVANADKRGTLQNSDAVSCRPAAALTRFVSVSA